VSVRDELNINEQYLNVSLLGSRPWAVRTAANGIHVSTLPTRQLVKKHWTLRSVVLLPFATPCDRNMSSHIPTVKRDLTFQQHIPVMPEELLTYSIEQCSSWEAKQFSASQEIPLISWNPKIPYGTHKWPPSVPILRQLDSVVTIGCYTFLRTELHLLSNKTFIPQIAAARSPWTMHSVQRHIISVGSCFVPPFWGGSELLRSCLTKP